MAKVGFKSALYTVVEGEDVMVTVCVSVLSGQLTSVVSLNYSLSVQPLTASGSYHGIMQQISFVAWMSYTPAFRLSTFPDILHRYMT